MRDPAGIGFAQGARLVAETAQAHADEHDREASFPAEAIARAKELGILGALIPREFGGFDRSVRDVAEACHMLGRACGSTGLIYAMHQIQVACLVRHWTADNRGELLRTLSRDRWLVASATTEAGTGGNITSSICALEEQNGALTLQKQAPVVSYGAFADAILATARRDPSSLPTEQRLALLAPGSFTLEPAGSWDGLGMRATCSAGFRITARIPADHAIDAAYGEVHRQTVEPLAHLLWASVWSGIVADALGKTKRWLRRSSGKGERNPAAHQFALASAQADLLLSAIERGLEAFGTLADDASPNELGSGTRWAFLKVNASELSVSAVLLALNAAGLAGYRNDGDYSIARNVRDILSAPLMLSNTRILETLEAKSLISRVGEWSTSAS